jgi:CRISPR-associated endonuclease/helicase Cas3
VNLTLLTTWSKRFTGQLDFALPAGWQLATHQKEVYDALHDPDIDVVFDTAMTGDGKSLAAYLPLLRPKGQGLGNGIFAYPTNELIRDQEIGVKKYQKAFQKDFRCNLLNGPEIAAYKDEVVAGNEKISSFSAIRDQLFGCNALLTNPDIFNLIYSFAYAPSINPATLAQEFSNRFSYIVFDEFHVFNTPQVAMILDAMLFIKANLGKAFSTKFLFLSATPQKILEEKLQAAQLRYCVIEGIYSHGDPLVDSRKILQEVTLDIQVCDSSTGGIVAWVQNNLNEIINFFHQNPHSKGAIICNSVFNAKQVYNYLLDALKETSIELGENTGLTGKEERHASYDKHLMIATSTVDVGVDFEINFLIFESLNAGTFIQRLGRVGRHEGFTRYHAVALLPDFMVQKLSSHNLKNRMIERPSLFNIIREVFPQEEEFKRFIPRWGALRVIWKLQKLSRAWEKDKLNRLIEDYYPKSEAVFNVKPQTWKIAKNFEEDNSLYEELLGFRGAGKMEVWVYDPKSRAVGSVNILRLISGIDFELLTKERAQELVRGLGNFYPSRLGLYAQINNYRAEKLKARLVYTNRFREDKYLNHAKDRFGFRIESLHPEIRKLSRALEGKFLCTCVVQDSSTSLRSRLRLPPFFETYDVEDISGAFYAVAFGQDALLLDSLVHFRKVNSFEII